MRREPFGANGSGGGQNGGTIIAPPVGDAPPEVVPEDCEECQAVPEWANIIGQIDCTGNSPAEATIVGDVFTATPGADLTTTYSWNIDASAIAVPYLCMVVPLDQAVFEAQFRYFGVGPTAISDDTGTIGSPYFLLRPGDPSPVQMSAYQRNTSWGDVDNGLTATVEFQVLAVPMPPPA